MNPAQCSKIFFMGIKLLQQIYTMCEPFSFVTNFSVDAFLHRAPKLNAVEKIQCSSKMSLNGLVFPKHHKQWQGIKLPPSRSTITLITAVLWVVEWQRRESSRFRWHGIRWWSQWLPNVSSSTLFVLVKINLTVGSELLVKKNVFTN